MFDIVGKRYWYFGLSALVVIPGLIALALFGLPLAIDFTGGSLLQLEFDQPVNVSTAKIKEIYASHDPDLADALVQTSGDRGLLIRSKQIGDTELKNAIEEDIRQEYGDFTELRFESIGPSVGAQVANRATEAVALAAVGILLYIAWAFRHVPKPFRYAVCAIVAMLHDVAVVVGLAAILGHFLGWEVDALFLTALLTVIGFSVHDSIVVFDRIRENLGRHRGEPFEDVVNHSIIQTLDRSINTQLTVLFTLTALTLFGGVTIRHFVIWLLIGILSGTYSSIFNASPLLVAWENGELTGWLRRLRGQQVPA
ncbi:MAG: protein translocase subunit SecF [Chloroflexi bacterium]|nr:MAG: protein translocase subunit SecF [Chloroflexota bacterium]